jgi:hypothetical protein
VIGLAPPAEAVELNVCEVLVEDLLIPPQTVEVSECTKNWRILLVLPHCVLPSCKLHPECVITRAVVAAAEQLLHAGDVHCSVRDISPEELFEKWARGAITNTAEILAATLSGGIVPPGFLTEFLGVAQTHFQALAARGESLPQPVQDILNAVADRAALLKINSFTRQDVQSIKIISDADPDADVYLKDWAGAITLGPVIVMKEDHFAALRAATRPTVTLSHMLSGGFSPALTGAIDLLVHEMIHVRQYRKLGVENFIVNYLLETIPRGYGKDSFEQEAYTFAATMADIHEGLWCRETRTKHNGFIEEYGLALEPLTCTAYLEPILPILVEMME